MIISGNRSTQLNGDIVFAVAEGYGANDIGRIMYENEINEMNLFNAIIKNDFAEIKARTEGTLLESELQAMQEASIAGVFASIRTMLQKFWEKMKAIFRRAYANLASYSVKYGKQFVSKHSKEINALNNDMQLHGEGYRVFKGGARLGSVIVGKTAPDIDTVKNDAKALIEKYGMTADTFAYAYTNAYMEISHDEYKNGLYSFIINKYMPKATNPYLSSFHESGAKGMASELNNAQNLIKYLKMLEFKLESSVKTSMKDLIKNEKAAKKGAESKEEKAEHTDNVKMCKMAATGMTNAISNITRSQIKLIQLVVKNYRKALAEAIALSKKAEKESKKEDAKTESADLFIESLLLEAEAEVEIGTSDDANAELTPEQEEVVDAIIDAAEALKDEAPEADLPDEDEGKPEEEPAGEEE